MFIEINYNFLVIYTTYPNLSNIECVENYKRNLLVEYTLVATHWNMQHEKKNLGYPLA